MSTVSTFSGFTMARLGIMASSKAMEVTEIGRAHD